jgi:hypothetical protein
MAADQVWCRVSFVGDAGWVFATSVLTGGDRPDLATVQELARLQLEAKHLGLRAVVSDISPGLAELLDLVGLCGPCSRAGRQPDPPRVEESGHGVNPPP